MAATPRIQMTLRLDIDTYTKAVALAQQEERTLHQWISRALRRAIADAERAGNATDRERPNS